MLDMNRIPNAKLGLCEDTYCDLPEEKAFLSKVKFLKHLGRSAWICEGCLESWMDQLDEWEANRLDFDLGDPPFVP